MSIQVIHFNYILSLLNDIHFSQDNFFSDLCVCVCVCVYSIWSHSFLQREWEQSTSTRTMWRHHMQWSGKLQKSLDRVSRSLSPSIYTSNIKYFIFNETFTLPLKALCKVASATIFLIVRRRNTMNDVRVIVTAAMMASPCVVLMAKSTKTSARWRCPPAGMAHGSSRCPSATAHRVSSATSLRIYSLHALTKSPLPCDLEPGATLPRPFKMKLCSLHN